MVSDHNAMKFKNKKGIWKNYTYVEIKQYTPGQPMGQKEIIVGSRNSLGRMEMKAQQKNLWDGTKSVFRGKS